MKKERRIILLTNNSKDCKKAWRILRKSLVPFTEVPADKIWLEIEWPLPTLFTYIGTYKGLKEIRIGIKELGYGKPN